jgi:hypothetical protein
MGGRDGCEQSHSSMNDSMIRRAKDQQMHSHHVKEKHYAHLLVGEHCLVTKGHNSFHWTYLIKLSQPFSTGKLTERVNASFVSLLKCLQIQITIVFTPT